MGDPSYLRYVPPSVANIPIDWSRVPEASKVHALLWAYDWNKKKTRPLPATIADLAKWFHRSKFFGYLDPQLCTLIMDISEFGLKKEAPYGPEIQVGPRFYMKYLEQVWFLLFKPGRRDCITGYSHDIIIEEDEDMRYDEDKECDEDMKDEVDELREEAKEHEEVEEREKEEKDEAVNEDKPDEENMEDEADEEDEDYDSESEEPGVAKEVVLAQQFDVQLEKEVSRGMAAFVKVTNKLAGWSASPLDDNLIFAQYAEAIMTLPLSHPAYTGLMSSVFRKF